MQNSFNIIVLIKQVPDIEKVRFDREKGRLDRSTAGAITNPFDLNALEAAVQIKKKVEGTVTAVSMGPKNAAKSLRDAISRGADKAILLSDVKFGGADTLATSYTLASALKKMAGYDLVLCGEKTIDGDTAQVGPEVAEILGIPHVAYVEEIVEASREKIIVKTRLDRYHYTIGMRLPGLITLTKDANKPQLPTLKDKIRSRKAEIEVWSADNLLDEVEEARFGFRGSPTWVANVNTPLRQQGKGERVMGTPEEQAIRLIRILEALNVLR